MAETVASKNRRARQEALREQLSKQKHVEHVVDIANKLSEPESTLETIDVQRYAKAAEIKLKIIDKYLPSLKQADVELSGTDGGAIAMEITKRVVSPSKD